MFSSNGLGDWEVGGKGRGLGREERDTCYNSGRKNVLRKLLRILYRRLKAGFSVC